MVRSFRQLIIEEPFRIFFPLGLLTGVFSVSLWPLYYADRLSFYPIDAHANSMILGFLLAFAVGFLGTAFPRLFKTGILSPMELVLLFSSWLAGTVAFLCNMLTVGSFFIFILLTIMGLSFIGRFFFRETNPPPSFILTIIGVLALWISLFLDLMILIGGHAIFSGWVSEFVRNLKFVIFPTFLLSGVAPYFFPKIMGTPVVYTFTCRQYLSFEWIRRSFWILCCTVLSFCGMLFHSMGYRWAGYLWAIPLVAYGLIAIPTFPRRGHQGVLGCGLTFGLIVFWASALLQWPDRSLQVAIYHQMMIGGVMVSMVVVSFRVVYAHAGFCERLNGFFANGAWVLLLLLTTATLRAFADFFISFRDSLLVAAFVPWVLALGIWGLDTGRYLHRAETGS